MTSIDAGIAALNKANELATTKPSCIHRQDNTTNSNPLNQIIQTGWGFILGDNTVLIEETVTFPVAFDNSDPIIICTPIGALDNSDPTTIDDLVTVLQATSSITPTAITASSFQVNMYLGATAGTTWRYGYAWMAIGTKG